MDKLVAPSNRLVSLDVMKGIIMLLLAAESSQFLPSIYNYPARGFAFTLIQQAYHHPWHGLRFWDLIQPSFMMVAGTVLYISYSRKLQSGITWKQNLKHVASRCIWLFLLGIVILSIQAGKPEWALFNVLTQLSFTSMVTYLLLRKPVWFQLVISFLLLIVTDICYRWYQGAGHPLVIGENFGGWLDLFLVGKKNIDGWVTFNCIPTSAHTIWGACIGKLLVAQQPMNKKIKLLLSIACLALLTGYAMDALNIAPIIKRICTSSFIIVSAGWVILFISFFYWLIDIKGAKKYAWVLTLVGMNAIFIYFFIETIGYQWWNGFIAIFTAPFLLALGVAPNVTAVIVGFITLLSEWYLCYFLYKRKIFFKL